MVVVQALPKTARLTNAIPNVLAIVFLIVLFFLVWVTGSILNVFAISVFIFLTFFLKNVFNSSDGDLLLIRELMGALVLE